MWLQLCVICALFALASARDGAGWTTDDFALFDLVEDVGVGVNFYDLLGVKQDSSVGDIKRAYRKLSLKLHPDRNDAADATTKFRQLASIYEVLRDETQRQKYHDVLEFGLPDWRQPIFYYRSVRKMPWWESALLLLLILTIGHYLMLWGAYWEKKLNVMDSVEAKIRREERKRKKRQGGPATDVDELIEAVVNEQVQRPHWSSLLPFLVGRGVKHFCVSLPDLARFLHERYWAVPERSEDEDAAEEVVYTPSVRFDPVVYAPAADDVAPVSTADRHAVEALQRHANARHMELQEIKPSSEWTQEELALLLKLSTLKYPMGYPNRWERIAETLKRRVTDVTGMGAKLKQMDPKEYQKLVDMMPTDDRLPWMAGPEPSSALTEWTQQQQKLFERALQQVSKTEADRWDKISRCVPGKTKEQCISRYKELADIIKQRKKKE